MRIKTVAELEVKAKELVECLNADRVLAGTPLAKVMAEKEIPSTHVFLKVPRVGYDPDFDAPVPDDTEAWQEAKEDDLIYVCQGVLRTANEESTVGSDLSLRMVLATKRAHQTHRSCFGYSRVDTNPDECHFIFNVNFTWFKSHVQCWIADRGVALPYRQKGCVTRASVQALRPIYKVFGDLHVESVAMHIGTALFYVTTPAERAKLKALTLEEDGTLDLEDTYVGRKPLSELLAFHETRLDLAAMRKERRRVVASVFALGLCAGSARKARACVEAASTVVCGAGRSVDVIAPTVGADVPTGPVLGESMPLLLTNG